jgi:tRNA1Val (adenine37-N6)-methyltransferase
MDVTLDSIRDIKIYQSKKGYRFSVDSLLLFDFVNLKKTDTIADLGAGSGIVGILLAKKYHEAKVTLFELQESLIQLAERNILLNNLEDRVKVTPCDLRTSPGAYAKPQSYDLVVSNPPFRKMASGRLNTGEEKSIARHEIRLSLDELIKTASYLLRARGRFSMIYHPNRLSELIAALKKQAMEPKRLRFVHSNVSSEAKMVLLDAVKGGRTGLKVEKPLFLYKDDGTYTDEMMVIYVAK